MIGTEHSRKTESSTADKSNPSEADAAFALLDSQDDDKVASDSPGGQDLEPAPRYTKVCTARNEPPQTKEKYGKFCKNIF